MSTFCKKKKKTRERLFCSSEEDRKFCCTQNYGWIGTVSMNDLCGDREQFPNVRFKGTVVETTGV